MTAREELHRVLETLPEEQIADVLDYIEDLRTGLTPETLEAVREGLADIDRGEVMSVEEYRRTRGV